MIICSLGLLCPGSCERTSCPDDVVRGFKMSAVATLLLTVSAKKAETSQIICSAETTGK